jgi:phosphopantothenoylcysteine decarboxylase/phosphopantothenate--cysteine ligase
MKVLLGVTGGIAAYKAAELVRLLQQRGIDVQVAMTASAEEFIRPLTFAALTGHPVMGSLWQPDPAAPGGDFAIEHIAIAQQIDALVIAPCTANTLAKLAQGLADDLISTVYLATRAPVILAPAMNVNMWTHPATRANVRTLEARGAHIVPPDSGYLACGMTGGGRLANLETVANAVVATLTRRHDLTHETILITAGGTREPIDAVRFLGNRSSGKMGHALAEEAVARGATVILITASPLPAPPGCETVPVTTAAEMRRAVLDHLPRATVVIKAAAVADFRPTKTIDGKLRRTGPLTLELEPTEDILAEVAARRTPGAVVIGFAAETENVLANARAKLARKGIDALVVNDVSNPEIGFDSDQNAGWWLTPEETIELPQSSKREMSARILDLARPLAQSSQLCAPFIAAPPR